MTLPNKITLLRAALAFLVFLCLLARDLRFHGLALFLFTFAVVTDWVDGYIARRTSATSPFGVMADPLADKLLVLGALVAFVRIDDLGIPVWAVFFIVARDLIIGGLRALAGSQGRLVSAELWGKWKMGIHGVCVFLILALLVARELAVRSPSSLSGGPESAALFLMLTEDMPFQLVLVVLITTWASGIWYLVSFRKVFQKSWS